MWSHLDLNLMSKVQHMSAWFFPLIDFAKKFFLSVVSPTTRYVVHRTEYLVSPRAGGRAVGTEGPSTDV